MSGSRPGIRSGFCCPAFAVVAAARELVGLLEATSARPSGNSVIGGVLALLVANWVPHVAVDARRARRSFGPALRPGAAAQTCWPGRFCCFVAVLMVSFVVQSLQFEKPGRTMAKIAGTILAVAYVGLLGSFTIQMRWFDGPKGLWPWSSWSRRPREPTPAPTRWAGSPAATSSGRR